MFEGPPDFVVWFMMYSNVTMYSERKARSKYWDRKMYIRITYDCGDCRVAAERKLLVQNVNHFD